MGVCLPGRNDDFTRGDEISSDDANYNWDGDSNSGVDFKQTRDVGQYYANSWGFFDMHGNIAEWTADWYQTYSVGNLTDPEGPSSGLYRVYRGFAWHNGSLVLRSAHRGKWFPSHPEPHIGFPSRLDGFK